MATNGEIPVLIVGSGPTGMVLAHELLRRRVPCRVIDRLAAPRETSRSFTLHARTLEMMEHIGIAHRFLEDGIRSKGFLFNFRGKEERPSLDFTALPGRYPFILVYNQQDTERVIRRHLESSYDFRPEWGVELTALRQEGDGVDTTLRHADGSEEHVRARWVIGADGVRSTVREAMGIPYQGEDYTNMVLQMMDVEIDNFHGEPDWIHYYMAKDHFLLMTALPGNVYRVLISDTGQADRPNLEETRGAFQEVVDAHMRGATLAEPRWITKWTIWKRMTPNYRQGRVFLAGDAAHCHSPSGGQGMNACMQDAFNLGWKLAMVERGQAHPGVLDTYEPERKPIAAQVIKGTHDMHDIIMAHGQGMEERLQLTRRPGWNTGAVQRISGIAYHYREQSEPPGGLTPLTPLPGPTSGDRAPDLAIDGRTRFFDLTRHTRFTLLLAPVQAGEAQVCRALVEAVSQRYPAQVHWAVVGTEGLDGFPPTHAFRDVAGELQKQYGDPGRGWAAAIRPDLYIGLRVALTEWKHLVEYFERLLLPSR